MLCITKISQNLQIENFISITRFFFLVMGPTPSLKKLSDKILIRKFDQVEREIHWHKAAISVVEFKEKIHAEAIQRKNQYSTKSKGMKGIYNEVLSGPGGLNPLALAYKYAKYSKNRSNNGRNNNNHPPNDMKSGYIGNEKVVYKKTHKMMKQKSKDFNNEIIDEMRGLKQDFIALHSCGLKRRDKKMLNIQKKFRLKSLKIIRKYGNMSFKHIINRWKKVDKVIWKGHKLKIRKLNSSSAPLFKENIGNLLSVRSDYLNEMSRRLYKVNKSPAKNDNSLRSNHIQYFSLSSYLLRHSKGRKKHKKLFLKVLNKISILNMKSNSKIIRIGTKFIRKLSTTPSSYVINPQLVFEGMKSKHTDYYEIFYSNTPGKITWSASQMNPVHNFDFDKLEYSHKNLGNVLNYIAK